MVSGAAYIVLFMVTIKTKEYTFKQNNPQKFSLVRTTIISPSLSNTFSLLFLLSISFSFEKNFVCWQFFSFSLIESFLVNRLNQIMTSKRTAEQILLVVTRHFSTNIVDLVSKSHTPPAVLRLRTTLLVSCFRAKLNRTRFILNHFKSSQHNNNQKPIQLFFLNECFFLKVKILGPLVCT